MGEEMAIAEGGHPPNFHCNSDALGELKLFHTQHNIILGMRTRISCLAPASQCVRKQSAEAARSRALYTDCARSYESARAHGSTYELRMLTFLSETN